jgi:hypothetical protein
MRRNFASYLVMILTACLPWPISTEGRDLPCEDIDKSVLPVSASVDRVYAAALHTVGNMTVAITNHGKWAEANLWLPDYITGDMYGFGSEYPR